MTDTSQSKEHVFDISTQRAAEAVKSTHFNIANRRLERDLKHLRVISRRNEVAALTSRQCISMPIGPESADGKRGPVWSRDHIKAHRTLKIREADLKHENCIPVRSFRNRKLRARC
jgi:hypothetical protein